MADETPYQQAGLIAQLQAERANAVAYGQDDRVAAVDKQLKGLGVKSEAAKERKAAAEDKPAAKARSESPKNRRSAERTEG